MKLRRPFLLLVRERIETHRPKPECHVVLSIVGHFRPSQHSVLDTLHARSGAGNMCMTGPRSQCHRAVPPVKHLNALAAKAPNQVLQVCRCLVLVDSRGRFFCGSDCLINSSASLSLRLCRGGIARLHGVGGLLGERAAAKHMAANRGSWSHVTGLASENRT